MNDTERELPNAVETEMSVLGACLLDAGCCDAAMESLQTQHFYRLLHQTIFNAIKELYQANETIDLNAVIDKLKSWDKLDEIGGATYLTDLIDTVSTTSHMPDWIVKLKEKKIARELIALSHRVVDNIYGGATAISMVEYAEAALFEFGHEHKTQQIKRASELMDAACNFLEERQTGEMQGWTTGLKTIDRYAKFGEGQFWVIGGRPSMGKTSIAAKMGYAASIDMDRPMVFFSLETSDTQLAVRLLCQAAHVDKYRMEKDEWGYVVNIANDIATSGIIIDDTPRLNPMTLRSKLRRYVRKHDVGIVVIDYLQLLDGTRQRRESRQTEMMEVSKDLKALCKEFKLPFLVLSQLNREVEDRGTKRPQLSDLRETGAIEQDADVAILLTRDEYYEKNLPESRGKAQIQVAKHRDGPTSDWLELTWLAEHTRFEDLSNADEEGSALVEMVSHLQKKEVEDEEIPS